jgi:hypothetical protein
MQPKEGTLPRAAAPGPDRAVVFEPWRHRFALAVAVAAAGLLAAGGLVTSTGSGLAVPDWPLSFGQLFPPMVGGVLFEHGHRMVASAVGFMTMILMFWFRAREPRPAVRWLAYAAFWWRMPASPRSCSAFWSPSRWSPRAGSSPPPRAGSSPRVCRERSLRIGRWPG